MNKNIIIIVGSLASGKSTFALSLSKFLNIPYLIKDTFKSALCKSVEINNREISSRFSAVTFDGMMYVTERLFETGSPVIIEGNFMPNGVKATDETNAITELIERYGYKSLTFKFTGNTRILYERFITREQSPERGQANVMFSEITYKEFCDFCYNCERFDAGGETIIIDTTDFQNLNFDEICTIAKNFINK